MTLSRDARYMDLPILGSFFSLESPPSEFFSPLFLPPQARKPSVETSPIIIKLLHTPDYFFVIWVERCKFPPSPSFPSLKLSRCSPTAVSPSIIPSCWCSIFIHSLIICWNGRFSRVFPLLSFLKQMESLLNPVIVVRSFLLFCPECSDADFPHNSFWEGFLCTLAHDTDSFRFPVPSPSSPCDFFQITFSLLAPYSASFQVFFSSFPLLSRVCFLRTNRSVVGLFPDLDSQIFALDRYR